MNHTCTFIIEVLSGMGIFGTLYALLIWQVGHANFYAMDPIEADDSISQVPGGFEPHLKRYQDFAQLLLTLVTASVAFLINFLVGIRPDDKRNIYSLRLEGACPTAIVFLGFSAIFAIGFILCENLDYETYCHAPERDSYTPAAYAKNLSLGYSGIICFLFAYGFVAFRLLS